VSKTLRALVLEVGWGADEHQYQLGMLNVLSQATVRRMTQLGLLMKDLTALSMSLMSLSFPSRPTLAMRPKKSLAKVQRSARETYQVNRRKRDRRRQGH
jgi:hypothetical protein